MGKKLTRTSKSRIRSSLRRYLWLRSIERCAALKRDNYSCQKCGVKQSKAVGREVSVEVHHLLGSGIDAIVDLIMDKFLCDPSLLQTLCKECHAKETHKA